MSEEIIRFPNKSNTEYEIITEIMPIDIGLRIYFSKFSLHILIVIQEREITTKNSEMTVVHAAPMNPKSGIKMKFKTTFKSAEKATAFITKFCREDASKEVVNVTAAKLKNILIVIISSAGTEAMYSL